MKKMFIAMTTVMMIIAVAMISGCKKDVPTAGTNGGKPTVETKSVYDITSNSALCRGVVEDNGNKPIIARGICWDTDENPTTSDNYQNDTLAEVGYFEMYITGLEPNTTYYVRAYATNDYGTAYGEQKSFTTADAGVIPGEIQHLPYFQSFETEFGTYITKNVIGEQAWTINYNTAWMCGYIVDNGTLVAFENEDWLISSPVSIDGVQHAKMVMTYLGRNFNSSNNLINERVTIWVSTDYDFYDEPSMASWTQIPSILETSSSWEDFKTVELNLDNYIGQTVTIAVKYESTSVRAGTIEVQSISVEEGEASGDQPGDTQSLPYTQSFASSFGTYTTKNVIGDLAWRLDYSLAIMSGYTNGTCYENEDWLISSPVSITGVAHAKMVMTYIGRYFNNINEDVTIWVSTNYQFDNMPSTAMWTQIPANLEQSSSYTDWKTAELSLDDYIGQTVTIAVKYLSTDTKAGTIEIQTISVEEGEVTPTPPGPTPPGPGTGSGTADDPYNVASGISLQGQDVVGWVQGYIVGAVKNGTSTVSSNDDIIWTAPFDSFTNVLIADDATCQEVTNCIIVNLPSGKPLRSQVNLYDNPDNLGKLLSVNGKLRIYFGHAGLRDSNGETTDFVLEGYVPPTPGLVVFSETFATGQGLFSVQDIIIPEELTYIWAYASQYSCMKASAYLTQSYDAESWLVSPYIDLTSVSSATLRFDQAVNYGTPYFYLSVMISTDYYGDVNTATWYELSLDYWPTGNNWTFISSTANLSQYIGNYVTIAFKYTSSTSVSTTWEVKNFVVEE